MSNLMNSKSFLSSFYHFRRFTLLKRYSQGLTYKILISRNNFQPPKTSDMIIMTPSFTYIPISMIDETKEELATRVSKPYDCSKKWDEDEEEDSFDMELSVVFKNKSMILMKEIIAEYKGEFILNIKTEEPFDRVDTRKNMNALFDSTNTTTLFKMPTEANWYESIAMFGDTKMMRLSFRMMPTMDEMEILTQNLLKNKDSMLTFPFGFSNSLSSLTELVTRSEDTMEKVKTFYNSMFIKSRKVEELATPTMASDYRTSINNMMKETLTYSKFKFWEKTRHNLFAEVVCSLMNWDVKEDFDQDMISKFGYMGKDCYKTPDYVLFQEEMNSQAMVDFAVTTGNTGKVSDFKRLKYENLRSGLSDFLKMDVSVDPVVWKINSDWEFSMPDYCIDISESLKESEVLIFLKETHNSISMMDNYEMYRKMSDLEDQETNEMYENKLSDITTIILEITKAFNSDYSFKTVDVNHSRSKMSRSPAPLMSLSDTTFFKEMTRFKMTQNDCDMYVRSATMSLVMAVNSDKCTNGISEVVKFDLEKINEWVDEEKKISLSLRNKMIKNVNFKINKMFKFPLFSRTRNKMPHVFKDTTPSFFKSEFSLEDGTMFVNSDLGFWRLSQEENDIKDYNHEGLGSDPEVDYPLINNILEFLMETRDMSETETFPFMDESNKKKLLPLVSSNMWEILDSISDLMENICYLEGRKDALKDDLDAKGNSKYTMIKNFGEYTLVMKKGSKVTSNKQIRYKVIIPKGAEMMSSMPCFHKWEELEENESFLVTKWLSITLTDIRHFLRVKEISLAMLSDLDDKIREENRSELMETDSFCKSYVTMMLVMLENRRGTSTTLQLNRYLVHSVTSFVSNRRKLIKDINSSPVRSQLEAYFRSMQLDWYKMMSSRSMLMWVDRIKKMPSTKSDYDRLQMPSMFDFDKEYEFSIIMNEMYVCNLFDKESGFKDHRSKKVVEKMMEAEMHFEKVKMYPESKGIIDDMPKFFASKDTLHTFDRRYVTSATLRFFSKPKNSMRSKEAIVKAMTSTIDEAMKITSSLKAGPYRSEYLEFRTEVVKSKSFNTLYEEVSKLSSNLLFCLIQKYDGVDAIFTVFPKAQIGGPREILIQSVMLRVCVKFLECISKSMCSIHEKEMLTRDRMKAEIQSEMQSTYKMQMEDNRRKGKSSMVCSMNIDSTRWSPGFVMENFMYFVNSWDVPDNLKTYLLAIVSSFSNKKMLVSEDLKDKWNRKPRSEKEFMEPVQFFREESDRLGGVVCLGSGMGQGMFHFLSSFYHCVMDDMMEDTTNEAMKILYNVKVNSTTLISSDDKTRMMLLEFEEGPSKAAEAMIDYVKIFDMTSRLSNIHINWKKSGLNFIITEFNSLFSVGKKMHWATIKDIYMANSIPDLTAPEEAVVFMLSNIRRCMEHGVYLTTIDLLLKLAKTQLMRYYRIDNTTINELCVTLNTDSENLPYQLGFVPTDMPVETLLYGPQVHMFKEENSKEMMKFYRNTYSAVQEESIPKSKTRKVVPFSENSMGKFWFELPTRLDKRLKEMKEDFFDVQLAMNPNMIIEDMEKTCLNVNVPRKDLMKYNEFCKEFFIGMNRKYEFQETMVVHSLIRALQLSRARGIVFPKNSEYLELKEKLDSLMKTVKKKKNKMEDINEFLSNVEELETKISTHTVDLKAYAKLILTRNTSSSTLFMYDGLKKVVETNRKIRMMISNRMIKSSRYTHGTMRPVRFFLNDVTLEAKPNEILNFIFDSSSDFKNSTVKTVMELINNNPSVKDYDYSKNPFGFIEKLMGKVDRPFNTFKEFLELNHKTMKYMTVNMISDLPCAGNAFQNITNMYRTKSSPDYVMDFEREDRIRTVNNLKFLTEISMNKSKKLVVNDFKFTSDELEINNSDDKVTRAMKMHYASSGENVEVCTKTYPRVEYKEYMDYRSKTKYYFWTDMNSMAKMRVKDNEAQVAIISKEDIEKSRQSERFITILKRQIKMMEDKGTKIKFVFNNMYTEEHKMYYRIARITVATMIKYRNTTWKMMLKINGSEGLRISSDRSLAYEEIDLMTDSYTVDNDTVMSIKLDDGMGGETTVESMMNEVPSLMTLNDIFLGSELLDEIELLDNNLSDNETSKKRSNDIREINMGFSSLNLQSTYGSLFSLMRKTKKEMEEITTSSDSPVMVNDDFEGFKPEEDNNLKNMMSDKGYFSSIAKAFREQRTDDDSQEDVSDDKMTSSSTMIKIIHYLVERAMKQELNINKDALKASMSVSYSRDMASNFHNFLIWQLANSQSFMLSNIMLVIMYNIVMKTTLATAEKMPSKILKRPDVSKKIPNNMLYITAKEDNMMEEMDVMADFA